MDNYYGRPHSHSHPRQRPQPEFGEDRPQRPTTLALALLFVVFFLVLLFPFFFLLLRRYQVNTTY